MKQQKPMFVGIAGGSGSGKTTIARKIAAGLPAGSVGLIDHDSYYHDHSSMSLADREQLNYDHPNALDNDLLLGHLDLLRQGVGVSLPIYDFKTHRRDTQTRYITPTPVIIIEGILVFVDERLRSRLDVKIFVDTDADIRVFRRIRRDMQQRGRTFDQVREQYYRTVRPMHHEFVEPSKRWADVIVPEGGNNQVALDLFLSKFLSVIDSQAMNHACSVQTDPKQPLAHLVCQTSKVSQNQPPPLD